MKNLDELYGSLYDLFNQKYMEVDGSNTATCTMEKTSTVWKCILTSRPSIVILSPRRNSKGWMWNWTSQHRFEQIREVLPENLKHLVAKKDRRTGADQKHT